MEADGFGARIRALREARNMSLRQFAQRIGVSPTYVSRVEREEIPSPGEKTIARIAKLLDEDCDEFLALGGKVAPDLLEIIKQHPVATARLLRSANERTNMMNMLALTEEQKDAALEAIRIAIDGKYIEERTARRWAEVAALLGCGATERQALSLARDLPAMANKRTAANYERRSNNKPRSTA